MNHTHFHHTDPRFCGCTETCRQFTFEENDVTCPACKARDRLELTEQGRRTVEALERPSGPEVR